MLHKKIQREKKFQSKKLKKMNIGKSFELTDDVKLTVEVINKGEQLHF